jgi:cation transport protein ChaC
MRGRRQLALTEDLVALVERKVADPGPSSGRTHLTPSDYESVADIVLAQNPSRPLWLFAYGSLVWKPDFDHVEHRIGRAYGWRRSFCLDIKRWRATPEQPGLMLALESGGSCQGMAYRLPDGQDHTQMLRLLKREISYRENLATVRWISVHTAEGKVRALAFWAMPRRLEYYINLPIEDQAHRIARAAGHVGSCADYLHKTVVKLADLGIHDSYLWRLQHLVADEIREMHSGADKGAQP